MKLVRVLVAAFVALAAAVALQLGTSSGAGATALQGAHTNACIYCGWIIHE